MALSSQERNARHRAVKYSIIEDAKSGPCTSCGGRFPACAMDLHHRDPESKATPRGGLLTLGTAALRAEIAKCDLLCANCHRIHHWEEGNAPS